MFLESGKMDQIAFQVEGRHLIADFFFGGGRGGLDGGSYFLQDGLYRFRESCNVLINRIEANFVVFHEFSLSFESLWRVPGVCPTLRWRAMDLRYDGLILSKS
jgi:hypothetical protein